MARDGSRRRALVMNFRARTRSPDSIHRTSLSIDCVTMKFWKNICGRNNYKGKLHKWSLKYYIVSILIPLYTNFLKLNLNYSIGINLTQKNRIKYF